MRPPFRLRTAHAAGITLVELMVSMVLGLIVIGGVVSVVLANKQSYRTNEALSQVQESARTAFELLARDIRQAGVNGCNNTNRVANVLETRTEWWQNWFGTDGYDGAEVDPAVPFGSDEAQRVNGTDSIQLQGVVGTGLSVETHDPVAATLKINAASTDTDIASNDILLICDFDHSTIFQASGYNSSTVTVAHNEGNGSSGNCSKGLGFPSDCDSATGNAYAFGRNSQIARFSAVDWYIGANLRDTEGGRSLYRRTLGIVGGVATVTPEEIVAGVTDMQIAYRVASSNDFVPADEVDAGEWTAIDAISIALTLDSADRRVSTDTSVNSGRLQRSFTNIITLRNRVP